MQFLRCGERVRYRDEGDDGRESVEDRVLIFGISVESVIVDEHCAIDDTAVILGDLDNLGATSSLGTVSVSGTNNADDIAGVINIHDYGRRLGHPMAAIVRHLGKKPTRGSAIVQLNGAANVRTSRVEYAGNLIARFGEAFDAQVHLFPVPAFFDFAETRNAMWSEQSIVRVLEAGDIETLDKEGIVGDVCTIFLREDGTYEDLSMNARATGPTPEELRSIPRRICGVAGDNKVVPLLAALRAGVITDLVVDEQTATKLVEPVMQLKDDAASAEEIAFTTDHAENAEHAENSDFSEPLMSGS